jgi:WD40 repeat protein
VSLSAATEAPVGVAADERGRAVLWALDPGTGRIEQRAQLADSGVTAAVISADGRVVATGMADGSARLWDASGSGGATARWGRSSVGSIALSADGETLLLGMADGTALVGPAGAPESGRFVTHPTAVSTAQLSEDGSVMLTASQDGTVSMRRVTDGAELVQAPHRAFHVAMDPAGRHLLAADVDGGVDLLAVGEPPATLLTRGPVGTTVGFSPDGTLAETGLSDGVTMVWRVRDQEPVVDLRGGSAIALRAALSTDGRRLVSGSGDGLIRIWALPDRPLILPATSKSGLTSAATSVAFTPRGDGLVTASRYGLVQTWDSRSAVETPSGTACSEPPYGAHCLGLQVLVQQGGWITRARYSPDGTLIATSGQNGTAVVWDAATADEVARVPQVDAPVDDLAFSADGHLLALGDRGGRTRLVEPRTGRIRAELKDGDAGVFAVAFTPDGHLLTGNDAGVVRSWDVSKKSSRVAARLHEAVFDLAVTDDGRTAAVASTSRIVLLDLRSAGPTRTLTGHSGAVSGLAFAPSGAMLVSGGEDGTVRVWDVAESREATEFRVPGGDVTDVAVDRTGRRIAGVSDGGDGAVFDCEVCGPPEELVAMADRRTTRELTAEERTTFGVS